MVNMLLSLEMCFNPLRIGSYCNVVKLDVKKTGTVSIPLESGHIVIKLIGLWINTKTAGFNPLRIGSYCNEARVRDLTRPQ